MAARPVAYQACPDFRPMNAAVRPYISELDSTIGARLDRDTHGLPHTLPIIFVDAVEQVFVGERIVRNAAEKRLKGCRRGQTSMVAGPVPKSRDGRRGGRTQTLLSLVEFLDAITRFELALTAFECRPGDADECRGPEWPLQESDVAGDLIERR